MAKKILKPRGEGNKFGINVKNVLSKITVAIAFLTLLGLSYLRETLFTIINAKMAQTTRNYAHTAIPAYLDKLDFSQLRLAKWLFSIGFSMLFIGITLFIIWRIFDSRRLIQVGLVIYLLLITESLSCVVLRHYFSLSKNVYLILHFGENLLQSPLVLMGLVALFYVQHQFEKKTD